MDLGFAGTVEGSGSLAVTDCGEVILVEVKAVSSEIVVKGSDVPMVLSFEKLKEMAVE